jgi:hypothetical protein
MKTLYIFAALLLATNLLAQTDQGYSYADSSIPELSQFEYYIGEWKSEMELVPRTVVLKNCLP